MAFPVIVATATSIEAADTTTHNCSLPTGYAANDLLLVFIAMDGSTGTIDVPAGWSQGWTDELHSSGCKFALRYKIADGGEGTTLDLTSSVSEKSAHMSFAIDAGTFDTTTPLEALQVEGTSATPDPPSLTITGGPLDVLWLAVYGADDDDDASAYPTNYTNGTYVQSDNSASSASMATARRELNASTENPGTFTIAASEEWIAATVAVRPSAGGTAHTLAAAPAVSSTAAGALQRGVLMAAAPAAVSTLTGSLAGALVLAAAPAGVSSLAGDLAVVANHLLAATSAAVSTVTVVLVGAYPLAATIPASATLAGDLRTTYVLAGASAAVSGLSATLALEGYVGGIDTAHKLLLGL